MTTNETLLPPLEPLPVGTPPDTIARKEQELSALLERVLAAPFKPVLQTLGELSTRTERSGQKLQDLADELSSTDENVLKVGRAVRTNAENLESLEEKLGKVARAVQASVEAAEKRDCELLKVLQASREEAQQATQMAARNARAMLLLFAIVLVILVGDIAFEVWGAPGL